MSRSQKWLGAGCAVALLCIWSAFVLIARTSAKHTLAAFDIAFMRFLFSSLAILPLLAWRVARAGRLEAVLGSVILVRTFALGDIAGAINCTSAYSAPPSSRCVPS